MAASRGEPGFAGVRINNSSTSRVHNNTFYANRVGLWVRTSGTGGTFVNNISYLNAETDLAPDPPGVVCVTCPTSNSRFADAANNDYRLCDGAGSPNAACVGKSAAIGAGTDLSSFFSTDITGSRRIAPWTIGAVIRDRK